MLNFNNHQGNAIKAKVRHHCTPIKGVMIETDHTSIGRGVEEAKLSCTAGGNVKLHNH